MIAMIRTDPPANRSISGTLWGLVAGLGLGRTTVADGSDSA